MSMHKAQGYVIRARLELEAAIQENIRLYSEISDLKQEIEELRYRLGAN